MSREREKKPNWVGLVVVLLFVAPEFMIPVGIFGGVVYLVVRAVKAQRTGSSASPKTTYTRKPEELDDCPKQPFCFHKDKGEHHVSRGKEIDPWDRPDIDIRKYQRKE